MCCGGGSCRNIMELIGGWGNNHAAIESNSTKEYKGRVRRFDIDIRFG